MSERKWVEGWTDADIKVLLTDGENIEVGYYGGYDITHYMMLPPLPEEGGDWSEGCPKPETTILVTDGREIEVGCYNSVDGFCSQQGERYLVSMEVENITHWMPLPPLPRKE